MSPRAHRLFAPIVVVAAGGLLLSLASASRASSASQRPANAPSASSVATSHQYEVADQGDVRLRVPPVVVASTDGLPANLIVGTAYVLELHVWVAAGQTPMAAIVDVSNSGSQACTHSTLASATISTIRCQVLPLATGAGGLVVTVRVGRQQAPVATARYTHAVTSPH